MLKVRMLKWIPAIYVCALALAQSPGRPATEAEIKAMDFTVLPNGAGLPKGHGDAVHGRALYEQQCQECHGVRGEGQSGKYPALAGGAGSLNSINPQKTVGSYWPYATTVWDYINRAMPYDKPGSLSADEVYALTAYLLNLNDIIRDDEVMNAKTLPQVKMPNRNGFIGDPRPDWAPRK